MKQTFLAAALAFDTLDLAPDLSALWQARPVPQTA